MMEPNAPHAPSRWTVPLRTATGREIAVSGVVPHELFMLEVCCQNPIRPLDALANARGAFELYGPADERLPELAYDLASFWMMRGCFAQALAVGQRLLPTMPERWTTSTLGVICHAAGRVGDRAAFDRAWDTLWLQADDWTALALLDVSRGAACLQGWTRAERAATTARDLAIRSASGHAIAEADALLDAVSHQRSLGLDPVQPPVDTEEAAETERLAEDLLRALDWRS